MLVTGVCRSVNAASWRRILGRKPGRENRESRFVCSVTVLAAVRRFGGSCRSTEFTNREEWFANVTILRERGEANARLTVNFDVLYRTLSSKTVTVFTRVVRSSYSFWWRVKISVEFESYSERWLREKIAKTTKYYNNYDV